MTFKIFLINTILERYADAFKNIVKAVEMVKDEKRSEEDKEQKRSNEIKAKLGIDSCMYTLIFLLFIANSYSFDC